MHFKKIIVFCFVSILLYGGWKFFHDTKAGSAQNLVASRNLGSRERAANIPTSRFLGGLASPFGNGQPVLKTPEERLETVRKEMERLKILPPEKYLQLSYSDLNKIADKDIYAALVLSERYYSDLEGLEGEKSYNFSVNPISESNRLLTFAAASGVVGASAILPARYQREGKLAEAEAWRIVSGQLGVSSETMATAGFVASPLDDEQRRKANEIVQQIQLQMLNSRGIAR